MKFFVAAGLATLLLQVNAGASQLGGGMLKMDACSFAKSVDMSADSSLCSKDAVYARTTKSGQARVMLVGEEKGEALKAKAEKHSANKSAPPRPAMSSDKTKIAEGYRELAKNYEIASGCLEVVGGIFLILIGVVTAALPVTAVALAAGGGVLMMDGIMRAGTGKSLSEHIYDRYVYDHYER